MPRAPKTNRRYISDVVKGQIIALHDNRTKPVEISRRVNVPATTVSGFIERYTEREDHKSRPHLGGPQKTTVEEDQLLLDIAQTNTRLSYTQVREQANSTLSIRTIQRRL